MSEGKAKADILLALGARPDLRLFNNPVGEGWQGRLLRHAGSTVVLENARRIRYGLCPGSSDVIGLQSVIVTPDMVGSTFGVFVALEIKAPGGTHRATPEQLRFIRMVDEMGGLGGVARTPEQAAALLRLDLRSAAE